MFGAQRTSWIALAVLALLFATSAEAKKKKRSKSVSFAALPTWVVEAAGRNVPDHGGPVTWLHQEQIVRPLAQGGISRTYRLVGRAEKASGIGAVDSFRVSYTEGDTIESLRGWTLRADETALPTDDKDDVGDYPAVVDSSGFNDVRTRVVSASGVVVGSIVAFEAEWRTQLDTGMAEAMFGYAESPTAYSRFEVQVPEGWSVERVAQGSDALSADTAATRLSWEAQDLAPLEDDELRPPSRDLLPRVWVGWWSPDGSRGYRDWNAVATWYHELSEPTLEQPGEAVELADSMAPDDDGNLIESLSHAFRFAARDVRYVSIDLGIGIGAGYQPDSPATICRNRYGDCKDKTNLLRALTQPWKLKSYPVLVRTRSRGRYPDAIASPSQFNHCIAAIVLPDGVGESLWSAPEVPGLGRVLFLDATVRNGSPWALRSDIQGTRALIVHDAGGTLVDLPVQPAEGAVTSIVFAARLNDDGNIASAQLAETWTGTKATSIRDYYAGMTEEERRRTIDENINSRFSGTKIVDYSSDGIDRVDSQVTELTTLEGGRLAQRVGDLLIVKSDGVMSSSWGLRLPKPPRRWNLFLGNPTQQELEFRLELPPGWKPEELPAGLAIRTDAIEAETSWSEDERGLLYRRKVRYLASEVTPERYEEFRDAVRQVAGADRQALVLIPE